MKRAAERIWDDIKKIKWIAIAFLLYNIVILNTIGAFCPVVIMTGFPCPGCGMTRALLCVLTGQFAEALRYHACIYLCIPVAVWFGWNRYIKGRKAKGILTMMGIVGGIMILFHIWRMVMYYPGQPPLVFFENNLIGRVFPMYNQIAGS